MRVKKQKRHRRAVRFFSVCHGFRQPFKVLCDGTFVHHLLVNQITPADLAVSNILGGSVKLFTSSCVHEELKRLGSSHYESLKAAQELGTARCEHDKRTNADACIKEIIGEKNSEHFFVATQDTDLRRKLQEVPGVPLIYGLRNSLFLEHASAFQRQYAKASEEERMHMTESEYKMLVKRSKKITETDDDGNLSDENDGSGDQKSDMEVLGKPYSKKRAIDTKDKAEFKRKRAKGPNPLSCKKKKTRENPNPTKATETKDGDNTPRSRNRKRKRSRKTSSTETKTDA